MKTIMKVKNLAVIVSIKKGEVHQVLLNEDETSYVEHFIEQLHNGKIKVLSQKINGIELEILKQNYEKQN
jgi:hypothetical protein